VSAFKIENRMDCLGCKAHHIIRCQLNVLTQEFLDEKCTYVVDRYYSTRPIYGACGGLRLPIVTRPAHLRTLVWHKRLHLCCYVDKQHLRWIRFIALFLFKRFDGDRLWDECTIFGSKHS